VLVSGLLFSIVLYTVWTSRLLRPIADDYGIAVVAHGGLFEGLASFWNAWSGSITKNLAFLLLAGIPLAYFPWALASSIPFIASASLMAALGTWLMAGAIGHREFRSNRRALTLVFVALLATWWGYWWLPVPSTPIESESYAIALAITHWQSLSADYVFSSGLLIWIWLLFRRQQEYHWRHLIFAVLIGLLAGFNGPVFASSSFALIVLLCVYDFVKDGFSLSANVRKLICASLGIVIGALVSHFSPGSQYRATLLTNPDVDAALISRLLTEAVPTGLGDWIGAFTSQSAIVVFGVMVGVTFLFVPVGRPDSVRNLLMKGVGLSGFSLIVSLANQASELFAYEAFWHVIGPRTIAWLGIASFAIAVGARLSTLTRVSVVRFVVTSTTALALYFLAGSLDLMCRQIIDRSEQWEMGPAPVYDTSDIEDPNGWVLPNWLKLRELRDAPDRKLP